MAAITKEVLQGKKDEYVSQRADVLGQYNALCGAIQAVEQLLSLAAQESPEAVAPNNGPNLPS